MRDLQVPVVRHHEERAAVLRIVVAVRPDGVLRDERAAAARTAAGIEGLDRRVHRAGEGERLGDANEVAAAARAGAGRHPGDVAVHRAGPDERESDGFERHPADRALAGLVVDDFRMHRAAPRHRRQSRGSRLEPRDGPGGRGERERAQEGREKCAALHHGSMRRASALKGKTFAVCRQPLTGPWSASGLYGQAERPVRFRGTSHYERP